MCILSSGCILSKIFHTEHCNIWVFTQTTHPQSTSVPNLMSYLCCSGWSWRWWQMCVVGRTVAGAAVSLLLLPPLPHSPGQWPSHSCDSSFWSILAWAECPWCPWYPCCPWQPPLPGTASHCRPAHIPAQSVRSPPPHSAGWEEGNTPEQEQRERRGGTEGIMRRMDIGENTNYFTKHHTVLLEVRSAWRWNEKNTYEGFFLMTTAWLLGGTSTGSYAGTFWPQEHFL